MTHIEILTKAVEKAIAGGWKPFWVGNFVGIESDLITGELFGLWQYKDIKPFRYSIAGILFVIPDFAKALWGEGHYNLIVGNGRKAFGSKEVLEGVTGEEVLEAWQYHLKQMVVADDPLQYLANNI